MRQILALSIFLLFGMPHTLWADELKVIYGTRYGGESRNDYPVQLLELALEKSGRPYRLEAYDIPVTQSRAMLMLEQNKGISVYYAGTSAEFERNLAPVRIPLYRGLLGYRIFIINKATQPLFSRISTLTELAAMRAGQGTGWSDVEILRKAGLDVSEAPYESLLKMLQLRRIDYFPRGINEAFPETEQHVETFPSLHVEQDLLLVYPFALFFFVNKDNHALHDALYDGPGRDLPRWIIHGIV